VSWELRHAAARDLTLISALRYVGELSYSLYAIHTPVMMLVIWALLQLGQTSYLLERGMMLFASLAVVAAVHYAIERPLYRPKTNRAKSVA